MNDLNLSEKIIKLSFNFSVWFIEQFHDMKPFESKVAELRDLPKDTFGYQIAECLDSHNLKLVPKYESHDLKHVLLGYKMTPFDEIRMQAFMLGNGNHTIPCFAILIFGAILLPRKWKILYSDFEKGRNTKEVSTWTIEKYANQKIENLKLMIQEDLKTEKILSTQSITKFGALASIVAGIFGMLFCLPFLFSSSIEDLVGAGLPFFAGAVLAGSGFLALSNLSKSKVNPQLG
ncbi:hypothetical protein [Flavobacterium selenitireducens]|uniref:hypothetical protein n=1 Tax=Flavobacterium selenitireducens TaxID=2722704 RepID=UPI00168B39AD|nr:hypothetical protein [Flavobacterium selenitireducens]MBD3584100.1 hypothetical protein [Flavobacterium selenitireducens]